MENSTIFKYTLSVYSIALILVIAIIGFILWRNKAVETPPAKSYFFKGQLYFEHEPSFNKPIQLLFRVMPPLDTRATKIHFLLPSSIELVGGELDWRGDIAAGETVERTITVKIVKEGNWTVEAFVEGIIPGGHIISEIYPLYISATEGKTQVKSYPPHNWRESGAETPKQEIIPSR